MSKEEIIAFIKESLKESTLASRLSAEDKANDEVDFEDSLGADSDYYEDDINLGLEPLSANGNALTQGGDESYDDEFSDLNGYQEFGSDYQVNPQDLPSVFSREELAEMIREGVERLHRQTTIKNRIQQINEELDSLYEKKYSDSASDFIGKEISHLMKDKGYSHDRAVAASINIAKDKGYKVPSNESEAPSAGLSAKKKSNVVKKAKAGGDIGKSGKGFEKVVSAAKKSGAKDPEAVAAAAMWKNIKREGVSEIMKRANDLMSEAKAMEKIKSNKNS